MIYTIGNAESYDAALAEVARGERPALRKVGRDFVDDKTGERQTYDGGSVWPTIEAARTYLATGQTPFEPGIYEVDADWTADTAPSRDPSASWRALLYDRVIVRRVA